MTGPKLPKRAEAGIVIGGYELVRRIGRGGMAEVWVARKALGKKGSKFVAIKLIADHHVGDERYARMFRSEAELAAVLSHANIVQVFDEGEDQGRSYLVMEWVDGLNLLKLGDMLALLDDEQRRFRVIAYIIGQLLHALHYAHSITSHDGSPLGVVHRDVSPQNVLVSNHGEVKLTDFGVAYYNIEESSGIHVKGKVRYMSPEQLSGQTRSPTVDLYAVGALLHELLDGRKFRGEFEDGQDLFSVVLSGHVSPMSRPVPPELDRLRLGLLEPDPARRIQTAEHAIALLKRYPDYGDARDELTKLCGSLTGVVKPRVGPGQSGQVAAADQATTRWGGRQALAKPKVDAARPGAPPPAKPSGPPQRTGSTTAVKSPSEALITGQTEFVTPQSLPGAVSSATASSNGPTTPLQRSGLRALASEPVAPGPAAPGGALAFVPSPSMPQAHAPAYVHEQPSSPLGVQPQAQSSASGVPVIVPEQSSGSLGARPLAAAGGAPHHVPAQPSHPLAVTIQPAPVWVGPSGGGILPTERLAPSEISGAAAYPAVTEPLDGPLVAERRSGSGTDRDIVPARVVGDGTDTDLQGRSPSRTSSAIARPTSSAMAIIGLGLVMVAVLSVSITWYLFSPKRDEVTASSQLAATVVESKPAEVDLPDAAEGKTEVVAVPGVEMAPASDEKAPAADDAGALAAKGEEPETGATETPTMPTAAAPAPTADVPVPTADAPAPAAGGGATANENPTPPVDARAQDGELGLPDDAKPSGAQASGDEPKPAKPQPKSFVKIFNNTGIATVQVRLGAETFSAKDKREHRITPGNRVIKWRKSKTDAWQTVREPWNFKAGKHFSIYVSQAGPVVRLST